MDDASLCQLIREALHSPQKAETLALTIDQLPEVKRYLGQGWMPYYDEALPVTERDVKRNINKFPQKYPVNLGTINCQNPSEVAKVRKCFINWVMMILKRDCQDVSKRVNRAIIVSMNNPIGKDGSTIEETIDSSQTLNPNDTPLLDALDTIIAEEELLENQKELALMETLLEEKLSNCYPAGYPQANCYELAQRRLLRIPPQKWKDLAEDLQGIPYGTVTSHWDRKCKPLLAEIE